jgi:pyridoxal phosphate enzyme (YggS family)
MQVNISGEASKSGLPEHELEAFADAIRELRRLRLRGLMAIPAPAATLEDQRTPFRRLCELQERLRGKGHELDTLSMGLTDDMEAAIAEGSTLVRIGTAIFGPRPAPAGGRG